MSLLHSAFDQETDIDLLIFCKNELYGLSSTRAHSSPFFSKLEMLDVLQVNTFEIAKFMFHYKKGIYCPHCFSIFLLQIAKFTAMVSELPVINKSIRVVQISSN